MRLAGWSLLLTLLTGCGTPRTMTVTSVTGNSMLPLTGGFLYALPHTQLQVVLTVSYRDYSDAPYRAYAQEYLGEALPASAGSAGQYSLQSVRLSTVASPDKKYVYYVEPGRNALYVDSRGLLQALNMLPADTMAQPAYAIGPSLQFICCQPDADGDYLLRNTEYQHVDSFYVRTDAPGHPSMAVTKADRLALATQAAAAADKLKAIEEKQQQLLFGEYEGNYAQEGVQFLYGQLQKMQASYLKLFIGEEKRDSVVCYVDPETDDDKADSQTVVMCYFSPTRGLLTDSLSLPPDARPVRCTITCDNLMRRATRAAASRMKHSAGSRAVKHALRYRMPQEVVATVQCKGFEGVSQRVPVMQFGIITMLPSGNVKAQFDSRTGALRYLSNGKKDDLPMIR